MIQAFTLTPDCQLPIEVAEKYMRQVLLNDHMVVLSVNFTPFSDLKYVNTGHDFFTDLVREYAKTKNQKQHTHIHQLHE